MEIGRPYIIRLYTADRPYSHCRELERERERERSRLTGAGQSLYARIIYSKVKSSQVNDVDRRRLS